MKQLLLAGAAVIGLSGWHGAAEAALIGCPAGFTIDGTAKVHDGNTQPGVQTAVSACQYLTPPSPSNVASIANINTAGFFGFDDWMSNGQNQVGVTGQGMTGNWSIASPMFATRDYIIVFKDGAQTNLIAFTFNEEFSSGQWSTPFTDPPFNLPGHSQSHGVSHWTIAYRLDDSTVPDAIPEPMSLALFGLGLVGLGTAMRRRAAP